MTQPAARPMTPVPQDGEPRIFFGTRVLTFLMASTDYRLGLFDDDALEAAHHAAHAALAGTVKLGDKDNPQPSPALVYDHIENTRRLISASLRRRQAEADAARRERDALLERFASNYPKGGSMPGPRMVVDDITPKPKLPPAPAFAALTAADVADGDEL
jgi:hypothetical protein